MKRYFVFNEMAGPVFDFAHYLYQISIEFILIIELDNSGKQSEKQKINLLERFTVFFSGINMSG
jgi:hypothetical protein